MSFKHSGNLPQGSDKTFTSAERIGFEQTLEMVLPSFISFWQTWKRSQVN
jgi:hypothetical protein